MGNAAPQKPTKRVRTQNGPQRFLTRKGIFAILPQTNVNVRTRPRALGGKFGHERYAQTHRIGHFFEALFIDHVVVGHVQHFGVAHIEFVLPQTPLAFRGFDWNARLFEVLSDCRRERLGARALQEVIIFQIPTGRPQVLVVFFVGLAVAIFKNIVFQFGGSHGFKTFTNSALQLFFEY